MKRNGFKLEQIIRRVREGSQPVSETSIAQLSWWLETTEQTYYRWRKGYGEMKAFQAMRLKHLEQEDLKKQVN